MLTAPFAHMMMMYDYGCEKRYGRPVPGRSKVPTQAELNDIRFRIEAAAARAGMN